MHGPWQWQHENGCFLLISHDSPGPEGIFQSNFSVFFPNSSLLVSLGVASCRQPVSRRCVPRTGSVPATCMTERRNVIIYSASCTWRKLHASAPTRQRAWLPTPKVSVPHACTCCICMSIGGSGPARLAADAGEEAKFASATACRLLRRTSMDPVAWQLSLLKKKNSKAVYETTLIETIVCRGGRRPVCRQESTPGTAWAPPAVVQAANKQCRGCVRALC
jgi:hypothetical protein